MPLDREMERKSISYSGSGRFPIRQTCLRVIMSRTHRSLAALTTIMVISSIL